MASLPETFNYKIIENEISPDFIPGLLLDYWKFRISNNRHIRHEKFSYEYTNRYLSNKYNISYSGISKIIRRQGSLKYTALLGCKQCNLEFSIYDRKDLIPEFDNNTPHKRGFCELCYRDEAEHLAKKFFRKVSTISDSFKIPDNTTTSELTYIEILILICALQKRNLNPNKISEHDWINFHTVEINKSEYIIDRLIKNKILPRSIKFGTTDELRAEYQNLLNSNHYKYIPFHLLSPIKSEIKNLETAKINLPNNFDNHRDFANHLFKTLLNKKLEISDIKDIEDYIVNKRIAEIESIFRSVCAENDIPYKMDNSLLLVFKRMAERFNLLECNNIIHYRSAQAVFNIQRAKQKNSNKYALPYFFRNILDNYILYVDENKDAKRYERPLPYNWVYSEVEAFVDLHICKDSKPWIKLTTGEIIEKWLISLDISS